MPEDTFERLVETAEAIDPIDPEHEDKPAPRQRRRADPHEPGDTPDDTHHLDLRA